MPPGWHMNRSWLHRRASLGQVSVLMWTQGQAEARKGRGKLGGGGGTLQNTKPPAPGSRSPCPTAQRLLQSPHG